MEQTKEQAKPEYGKYDPAQPLPPPTYAPVQPYPARQYAPAPYPYRRARGPVLPMMIIAALIVAVFVYGLGSFLFGTGNSYNHDFALTASTPATLHINSDSIDLKLNSSPSVGNSLNISAKGIGGYDTRNNGNDITFNVQDPGGFTIFGFGHAEVDVTMPPGTSLDLHTGSGSITLSQSGDARASDIKMQTGSGDIKVSSAVGNTNLQTGSGNIEVNGMQNGNLNVQAGSGSIKVEAASPKQSLTLHTGSGDIEYTGDLASSSTAQTGSGDITFHLGPSAGFQADWHTGSGDISNDFGLGDGKDVTSKTNNGSSSTTLPTFTIKSGSGDINVSKGQ